MDKIISSESPSKNRSTDRFDQVYINLSKKFKDDYIEGENKIFINTLNHVCKHFDSCYETAKSNK